MVFINISVFIILELKASHVKNNALELKYNELQTVSRSSLAIANRGFDVFFKFDFIINYHRKNYQY